MDWKDAAIVILTLAFIYAALHWLYWRVNFIAVMMAAEEKLHYVIPTEDIKEQWKKAARSIARGH